MTIHVNIGEAKTRRSKLVAASQRGEVVVIAKAGKPIARLVPIDPAPAETSAQRAARRVAAIGMFGKAFEGYDLSLGALKADRPKAKERERRALGIDL